MIQVSFHSNSVAVCAIYVSSNSNFDINYILVHKITILFPATENALRRIDKREVWSCNLQVLVAVAKRWALRQSALEGAISVYTDLTEKLRVNALGQAEVDDFLWIMVIQWAKLTAWFLARSAKMSSTIEKNHLDSRSVSLL